MTDPFAYEPRLESRLKSHAARVARPFDASAIAARAAAQAPRPNATPTWSRLLSGSDRRASALRMAVIGFLLLTAVAAGAVIVGSILQSRDPLPVRPALVDHLLYAVDGAIYLADPDGRNPVRIDDGGQSWSASWSPDGRHLSFSGDQGIQVSDATGHVVFSTSGCCSAWSPDGSLIAILVASHVSGRADAEPYPSDIVILRPDGTIRSSLQVGTGRPNFLSSGVNIYWTPDGRSVTFTGVTFGDPDSGPGWLYSIDGGNSTKLSVDPAERSKTYVSPDGIRLVGGMSGPLIVAAAADGSGARPLAPSGSEPATWRWYGALWSPDGGRIAASASSDRGDTLYVIDVDTGNRNVLAESPAKGDSSWPIDALSWDGQRDRILFRSSEGLSIIGSDGSDPRLVVEGGIDGAFQPAGGGLP